MIIEVTNKMTSNLFKQTTLILFIEEMDTVIELDTATEIDTVAVVRFINLIC